MKKYLSLFFVLLMALLLLVSCGDSAANDDPNTVRLKTIDNLSEYVVVRGESSSSDVTALATTLRKAINDATGASVAVKTDFYSNKYEILIGETKRQQSIDAAEGLRYYDYTIKLDGNKLIVVGGSDEALGAAVELFKAQFIDAEKKTVKVPSGSGYTYKGTYKYDKITVEGVDICDFDVFYDGVLLVDEDGELPYIDTLRTAFGSDFKFENDLMQKDNNYIVLDNTGLIENEYSIEIKDGNIYIKGSYNTIDEAMDYFVGDFFGSKKSAELKSGDSSKIMTTEKKEIYTKDQLMTVLTQVYNNPNACIIGQQCFHGVEDMIDVTIQDFVNSTGQVPGMIGIDTGIYGVNLRKITNERLSQLVCEAVDYCSEGGILTASGHWYNPYDPAQTVRGDLGDYDTIEEYEAALRAVFTPGNEYYDYFMKELTMNGDLLQALEDNNVPIIWRPLHEMNGNWFWYCVRQDDMAMSADTLVDMWKFVYEYLEDERGLENLLWCYGPNTSSNVANDPGSTMSPMYCYPGDEYVDIVGVDWYTSGNLEIMKNDNYISMVDDTKKIGALTEFGPSGAVKADTYEKQHEYYSTDSLLTDLWTMLDEGYSFTYLLTWHNESFCTIGALGGEEGGFEFMNEEYTLGQAEVKAMLDALK